MALANITNIALIGLAAGALGTGLGGLLSLFFRTPGKWQTSFALGFAGGVMLAIVFMDLLPEALESGGFFWAISGLMAGVVLILLIDLFLPHNHFFVGSGEHAVYARIGIKLGLGITMHNLPEGIAIGAGYVASPTIGLALAVVIFLHNIPEGLAMGTPMSIARLKSLKILLYTGVAGIPVGLGALIGSVISNISPLFLSLTLGFAGGAMLYIIFDDLIPGSQKIAKGHSGTFGAVFGTIAGIFILMLLH